MRSRRESEDILTPSQLLDDIFPTFLFNDMQDQLDENLQKLQEFYKQYHQDDNAMDELAARLYNSTHRCHNAQVVEFFRRFCGIKKILLEELPVCKWHPPESIPPLLEVGRALEENRPFKFMFIPPVPETMHQTLNDIFLLNGCIPNLERLLLLFPTYLELYFQLNDILLEQTTALDQATGYFLAVCSAAQLGCIYAFKRYRKRFLEIGGSEEWLHGEYPNKIRNILPLGHLLAYSPYEVTKEQLQSLMEGPEQWSSKALLQAGCIMCFCQFASSLALANGVNPEDPNDIAKVHLNNLKEHVNWQLPKPLFETSIYRHRSNPHTGHASQQMSAKLNHKPSSLTKLYWIDDYTKHINEQLKSNLLYDQICEGFKPFLPPYRKISRRNEQTHPNIEYNEYNFAFNSYVFLKDHENDLAERILSLIDLSKDMTAGKVGQQQTNTTAYRRAIRYYCQNLVGYTHQQFNYKQNMTELLSKEMKFFIKLLTFQPFLLRKQVVQHIPHQKEQLSTFDVIHVSVLVLTTKLQYTLMFLCKAFQGVKQ